jgi:hypothetical protein
MFTPTRDQARDFLFEVFRKGEAGLPLTPLEGHAADIIRKHPEYHDILRDKARYHLVDWSPETGQMNPFLHLNLHLAILEQLSIDQPPGIRARHTALLMQGLNDHDAEHIILEALAETLWEAQRDGSALNAERYLARIQVS